MRFLFFSAIWILAIFTCCSSETSNKMENKKFKESGNTAVFTTKYVVIDKKDITTVSHEKEDGAWQFFSDDPLDNFEDVVKVVGLGEIIKLDSTVLELADMPEGFTAKRKHKADDWIIQETK